MPAAVSPRSNFQMSSQLNFCVSWIKRRAALYFDFLQQHSPQERAFLLMGFVEKGNPEEPSLVDITCLSLSDLKQNDPPIKTLEAAVESYSMQNEFVAWIVLEREERSARCEPIFTHVLTVALSETLSTPPALEIQSKKNHSKSNDKAEKAEKLEKGSRQSPSHETESNDRIASLELQVATLIHEQRAKASQVDEMSIQFNSYRNELGTVSSEIVSELRNLMDKLLGLESNQNELKVSHEAIEKRQVQLAREIEVRGTTDSAKEKALHKLHNECEASRDSLREISESMRRSDARCATVEKIVESMNPRLKACDDTLAMIVRKIDKEIPEYVSNSINQAYDSVADALSEKLSSHRRQASEDEAAELLPHFDAKFSSIEERLREYKLQLASFQSTAQSAIDRVTQLNYEFETNPSITGELIASTKEEMVEMIRASRTEERVEELKTQIKGVMDSVETLKVVELPEISEGRQVLECVRETLRTQTAELGELRKALRTLTDEVATLSIHKQDSTGVLLELQQVQHRQLQLVQSCQHRCDELHTKCASLSVAKAALEEKIDLSIKSINERVERFLSDNRVLVKEELESLKVSVDQKLSAFYRQCEASATQSAAGEGEIVAKVQDFVNAEVQGIVMHVNRVIGKVDSDAIQTQLEAQIKKSITSLHCELHRRNTLEMEDAKRQLQLEVVRWKEETQSQISELHEELSKSVKGLHPSTTTVHRPPEMALLYSYGRATPATAPPQSYESPFTVDGENSPPPLPLQTVINKALGSNQPTSNSGGSTPLPTFVPPALPPFLASQYQNPYQREDLSKHSPSILSTTASSIDSVNSVRTLRQIQTPSPTNSRRIPSLLPSRDDLLAGVTPPVENVEEKRELFRSLTQSTAEAKQSFAAARTLFPSDGLFRSSLPSSLTSTPVPAYERVHNGLLSVASEMKSLHNITLPNRDERTTPVFQNFEWSGNK